MLTAHSRPGTARHPYLSWGNTYVVARCECRYLVPSANGNDSNPGILELQCAREQQREQRGDGGF